MSMKFSIIIPCYNAEKWIEECLISALTQTYENAEVIFVDNESTDESLQIAKEVKKNYPDLTISSAPNIYRYSWEEPVEEGLKLATGEYFTIVGADDYIAEDYVENIVNVIAPAKDKIKVLQSPIMGLRGNKEAFLGQIKHSYTSTIELKRMLFEKCPVNTPTVVYSKELHDKGIVRWQSHKFLGAVDYDLYFNLVDNGIFIYPYPKWLGYYYRWHEEQATWGMHKEPTNFDQKIKQHWRDKWTQN